MRGEPGPGLEWRTWGAGLCRVSLVDATSYESIGVGGGGADDRISCGLEGETERWSVCCPVQAGLWGVSFCVKR